MNSNRRGILTALKIADLTVVVVTFALAVIASIEPLNPLSWTEVLEIRIKLQNVLFLLVYVGYWHFVLKSCGLYRSYRLSAAARELRDLAMAVLIGVAPLAPLGPLLHFDYVGYGFLLQFTLAATLALSIERRSLRAIAHRVRRFGRNLQNTVIVGTGDGALDLTAKLARRSDLGFHVVEVIQTTGSGAEAVAVLARVKQLIDLQPIDEVFIALPLDSAQSLVSDLVAVCEEQGITVRVTAHVAKLSWAHALVDEIEGDPVLMVHTGPPDSPRLAIKRLIDLAGATAGLVVLAPVFLIVAILIKLDSNGPVLFAQERVGYQRRRFRALKFRSMIVEAESMQASLESLNEATGPVFKIENDPRVTAIGKWLRKSSIDELPQLVNVLKGEMSLVGPRPLPVRDVDRIDVRWHRRRFSVKPGITCLWQANRRVPAFDEWIKLDMEYIDTWSLTLDLKILVRTIPTVLSGQGVH
jgi:exopolysaccharide biosynthesis polyprenyl glycosylphosphotransferase